MTTITIDIPEKAYQKVTGRMGRTKRMCRRSR
jgi:hypothetical protein